jgi:diguanylate cyclase (GGDEF)-like protein
MRAYDWHSTSLGPPENWPVTLKTAIRMMLMTNHPMLIMWGAELIQFYNDAFSHAMGSERHPGALGRCGHVVWAEIWHVIGPDIDKVMSGQGATWYEDRLIGFTRYGKQENIWWTYGYIPIEDESGVQGLMVICNDVTKAHLTRVSMQQSYQVLVESMDEGFCVIDVYFDADNHPVDYRYVEINPAFEKQSGLRHAMGKTIKELAPDIEEFWLEIYIKVALTGEPVRFVNQSVSLGKWLDVYATRIGDAQSRKVGVLFKDITQQMRAEEDLHEVASRLQFALDAAQIGDWYFDLETGTSKRSLRHDLCFGYEEPVANWGFDTFISHVHPDDREWVAQDFKDAANGLKDLHIECRVIWPDKTVHWIAAHGSMYGTEGHLRRMIGIVFNITERKFSEERIRHASLHDPLTGLPNRAMLFEYASHMLPFNKRTNQMAAVLFCDLDRFKPINDTHGHEVGDVVLQIVADRLSKSLRAEDIVIRLGGDEFVIFLQNIKNATDTAASITRHILSLINQPYQIGELSLSVSTSVGISIFPNDGQDIDTLISHADMAMYQAKQVGRDNFQFYCPEFDLRMKQHLFIEQNLKSVLSKQDFYLCYQPVLSVETGQVVSVEALLRWQNSEIGPDQFVPIAESTGIINPIGRWLLEEAARQYLLWVEHGLPAIPIAVNVSVVEFRDKNFVRQFADVFHKYGLDVCALQLELTETAMMDNFDHAVLVLSQLKAMGVTVLLDDFGTGYSSLAYLARLPLDKVKIDKSFVSGLEHDLACRAVIDAMITLGRKLNLEVVAEGIESADMYNYVSSHGCTQAQGFYLGRPMRGLAFETWYRERNKILTNNNRDKNSDGSSKFMLSH